MLMLLLFPARPVNITFVYKKNAKALPLHFQAADKLRLSAGDALFACALWVRLRHGQQGDFLCAFPPLSSPSAGKARQKAWYQSVLS
jgi:hypothetical protein